MALSKINTDAIASDAITSAKIADAVSFGQILQVKQARKSTVFSTSSTTFQSVTDLSVSITPASSNSRFLIMCSLSVGANWWSSGGGYFGVARGSSNIAGDGSNMWVFQYGADSGNSPHEMMQWHENFVDDPSSSSALTYTAQIASGNSSYTIYVNRRNATANSHGKSWLTVMEIES